MTYVTSSFDKAPRYPALRFFHQLHRLYAVNAWLLLKIITPAVVFSGVAVLLASNRAAELLSHARTITFPSGFSAPTGSYAIAAAAIRIGGWMVSWLVNVFAFAAIATAINHVQAGLATIAEECYAPARERVRTVTLLALILFALVVLSVVSGGVITAALLRLFPHFPSWLFVGSGYAVTLIGFALSATYSLSVPVAISGDKVPVWTALKRSDFLTRNSFGQIFLLIIEATVSGYLAAYLPYWAAGQIAERVGWNVWASWLLWATVLYGVAMADLVLLIGLAVLYWELEKISADGKVLDSGTSNPVCC